MLTKEILSDITLDELKDIRDDWRRIDHICNTSKDGCKRFGVTQEDAWYVDRDIDTDTYRMRITTYKDSGKTIFSTDIVLYNDVCEIAETNIDELESFIKEIESDTTPLNISGTL